MSSYRHPLQTFLLLPSLLPSPLLNKRAVSPKSQHDATSDVLTVEIDILDKSVSRHGAKSNSSGLAD